MQNNIKPWGFVAFPLTIIFVFTALPTIAGVILSFFEWSGGGLPAFVGLQNYHDLVLSATFWPALRNTLIFAAVTVPVTVILAFLFAAALNSQWFVGRTVLRTVFFMPTIVSIVAIGFIWRWLLAPPPTGLISQFLITMGLDKSLAPDWLGNSPWGLASIIIVSIWRGLGFSIVLYLAALGNVSRNTYDAAAVDGANSWQALWNITWPGVRPMTIFLLITGFIGALQIFDIVLVMTGNTEQAWTDVLNLFLYREFTQNRLGFAAAIGVMVLLMTIIVTAAQLYWISTRDYDTPQQQGVA